MGNRSSSAVQPAGPPPLLCAVVVGDVSKFNDCWTGEDSIDAKDGQGNNVLHALFSCRVPGNSKCSEILKHIHNAVPTPRLKAAYRQRNEIGCTPLWILVAYGNVDLLKEVQQSLSDDHRMGDFPDLLRQPNNQGDSPFLATCSQGNTDMVRFLKDEVFTPDQFKKALSSANRKGTTPLQIIVGNNHGFTLDFILQEGKEISRKQLLERNTMGLSLFHICSERNAHEILQTILKFMVNSGDCQNPVDSLDQILALEDKNGANPIHVAAFCGNAEAVQVWIDVIKHSFSGDDKAGENPAAVALDKLDGQSRTAYWLAMVQGRDDVGKLLAGEGVDVSNPKMVEEIEEAQERRKNAAATRQLANRAIDGSVLLNR